MNAMIFAAGYGKRLAPLTDTTPKPLIDVGGHPMLYRVIDKIKAEGISTIVVNVHHLAYKIRKYLEENDNFGLNILISDESPSLLDTGGGLVKASTMLDSDDLLLYNADILSSFPLKEMIAAHKSSSADATLLVSNRETSRYLLFSDGRMKGWKNVTTGDIRTPYHDVDDCTPLAFGGVHILSPNVIGSLKEYARHRGEVFSITDFYIQCCDSLDIRAYTPGQPFTWFDIGKPATLEMARKHYANS